MPFTNYWKGWRQMKGFACVMLACFSVYAGSVSAAVDPDAPARSWANARTSERADYARTAAILCQSRNCGPVQVRACMDEVVRPPMPAGVSSMTIGEIAIGCIKMLKVRD